MIGYLASPSGRKSIRRLLFALAICVALSCVVLAVSLDRDIKPGVVAVIASVLTVTATAVTAGRFAERGSERPDA